MGLFFSDKKSNESELISDLDAMIQSPVAFRLHGKTHHIKPISTKEFFLVTNAISALFDLQDKSKKPTADAMIDGYAKLMASVCDTIKRKDIEQMNQAQIGALFQLVIDSVTGRAHVNKKDEKKNTKA